MATAGVRCLHCGNVGQFRRGLCQSCYRRLGVRESYDRLPNTGGSRHEPTADEVEATVAEQMKRLPRWWRREAERGE